MTRQYREFMSKPTDQFDWGSHSSVKNEIRIINEKSGTFPVDCSIEIIISLPVDHFIQNNWRDANPELADGVTSHALFTGSIKSLLASCRKNPFLQQGLEAYLKER